MTYFNAEHTVRMNELQGAELAGFTRRWLAFFLDVTIMAALFFTAASAAAPLLLKYGMIKDNDEIIFALNLNWYSIAWTVLYFSLAAYFGNGKTPGKWIMGIRIVSLVHSKMTLWHSLERALGYGASFLELGFGFFQYFIHPNRCTVHDRIAETIVLRETKKRK